MPSDFIEAITCLTPYRSFELRLKRNWTVPSSGIEGSDYEPQPMWILLSIFPELADDGEVLEIVGCFSDIRYTLARYHHIKTNM